MLLGVLAQIFYLVTLGLDVGLQGIQLFEGIDQGAERHHYSCGHSCKYLLLFPEFVQSFSGVTSAVFIQIQAHLILLDKAVHNLKLLPNHPNFFLLTL